MKLMFRIARPQKLFALFVLLAGGASVAWGASRPASFLRPEAQNSRPPFKMEGSWGRLPLAFEPAPTRWAGVFLAEGAGYRMRLAPNGAVLTFQGSVRAGTQAGRRPTGTAGEFPPVVPLRLELVGANAGAPGEGLDRQPGVSNYLVGTDRRYWRTRVPRYSRVRYRDVYPGVDLVYYGSGKGRGGGRELEYDFVLKPGADPGRIRLKFTGARAVTLDDRGDLRLSTARGELRQRRPEVYQQVSGKRVPVQSRYVLGGTSGDTVEFQLGEYRADRPLVIDPHLIYSSYIPGNGLDLANGVAVDDTGSAYVVGNTNSDEFLQVNRPSRDDDVFVVKFSPDGQAIEYRTVLGSTTHDRGMAIAVDGGGHAYVTGETLALQFPTTPGVVQPSKTMNNSFADAFALKLSPDGSQLLYSTHLGGPGDTDTGTGIVVDAAGNACVVGNTYASDFPVYRALDTRDNFTGDAFVVKLNATAKAFVYSTYLGSNGEDIARGACLDAAGNLLVVGSVGPPALGPTSTFPQVGVLPATPSGGLNAFITKIDRDGTEFLLSTRVGGSGDDVAEAVTISASGSILFTGYTSSANFSQLGANRTRTDDDAFLMGIDPSGTQFTIGAYLGGTGRDRAEGIGLDSLGGITIVGNTQSADFPLQNTPLTTTTPSRPDVFVSRWVIDGGSPSRVYSALFGGNSWEECYGLAVGQNDTVYIVGATLSSDLPTLNTPLPGKFVGGWSPQPLDAFVARISPARRAPENLRSPSQSTNQITLAWDYSDPPSDPFGQYAFALERKSGGSQFSHLALVVLNARSFLDLGLQKGTSYTYRIRLTDQASPFADYPGWSNELTVTTIPDPPAAPTGLTVQALSQTQLKLSWTDNSSNEQGFQVEQSPDGTNFTRVEGGTDESVDTTFPSFTLSGLTPLTTRYFRVRARNRGGFSDYSNTASGTTLPTPPATPSGLQIQALSQTQLKLSWTDNSSNETGFRVERRSGGGGFGTVATLSPNLETYMDSGLTAGTTYSYRIVAVNSGGESGFSNTQDGTTLPNAPGAPANLQVTVPGVPEGRTQLNLSWTDASSTETGFEIEVSTNGGGTWVAVVTTQPNATAYSHTGRSAKTAYAYRIRALNSGGPSAWTGPATGTTLPNPPNRPSGVQVTPLSQSELKITWVDDSLDETGFRVERRNGDGSFTPVGTVAAGVTTLNDTGRTANTGYTFRVFSFNSGGDSQTSDLGTGTTLPNPPVAPVSLTVETLSAPAGSTSLRLSWTEGGDTHTGFRIERRADSEPSFSPVTPLAGDVVLYMDGGLTPNTKYHYRVRALNSGGVSLPSNTASGTTLPLPPAAPTGLTVTVPATPVGIRGLDLAWTDNAGAETGYLLERKAAGGAFTKVADLPASATAYQDRNLQPFTAYTYRLRAVNPGGLSEAVEAEATTRPEAPASPADLVLTVLSQTSLKLDWTDRSDVETSYRVEQLDGGVWGQVAVLGLNTTTHTVTGLLPNTRYLFRVRAVNDSGASSPSNEAAATTLPNPPTSPSSLQAVVHSKSEVKLTWTDASNNEDGFRLFRKAGEGEYLPVQTLEPGRQTWTDTGLQANTLYAYQVVAFVGSVASSPSNTVTVTTRKETDPPVAPTGLFRETRSATSVRLKWTDNAGDETGFRIERALLTPGPPNFATTFEVGADVTQFTDANVPLDAVYVYQVVALNGTKVSEPSNRVEFDTLKKGQLKVNPLKVNFGTVKGGKLKTVTVTVSNTSKFRVNGTLSLTGAPNTVTLTGGGSFVLEAKQAKKVTLTFTPTAAGQSAGGGLVVQSTDRQQGKITVPLAGKSR